MTRMHLASAFALAFTLAAVPAFAQRDRGSRQEDRGTRESRGSSGGRDSSGTRDSASSRDSSSGRSWSRGDSGASSSSRGDTGSRSWSRGDSGASSGGYAVPRDSGRNGGPASGLQNDRNSGRSGGGAYRSEAGGGYRADSGRSYDRGAARGRDERSDRGGWGGSRGRDDRYGRGYGYSSRYDRGGWGRYREPYRSHSWYSRDYRPYRYSFRRFTWTDFGLWLGYSLLYPYSQPYYPTPESGYPSASWGPTNGAYGGISFEIDPNEAEIVADGQPVGTVYDFYDPGRPLTLSAGRHHIEVYADGYEPIAFDVTVVAGQVLPYQGSMRPLR